MKQGELFDAQRFNRQGPLSVRQFMEQTNWHGTDDYGDNWAHEIRDAGIPVHSGTLDAAAERTSHGNFYPVRPKVTGLLGMKVTDRQANRADWHYQRDHYTTPSESVSASSGVSLYDDMYDLTPPTRIPAHQAELEAGRSLAYINESEGRGSVSHVSPPGGFETLRDTSNISEMPPSGRREFLKPAELRAQGVFPVEANPPKNYPGRDARLIEEVEGGRGYLRGEDVQALPDPVRLGLSSRKPDGTLHHSDTKGGRRGELFDAMRRI